MSRVWRSIDWGTRIRLGRARLVVLSGHLDTVPINRNLPSRREGDVLHGCGTVDMKGGDAVMLAIAALSAEARHDLTFVFYDCEEIEAERNGLTRIQRDLVKWLRGD